ncbi:MAG: MerR family transcriptional regulator [Lachnospiraceae bacterium]|nr:MerR family transcriptional regulator [Lachnospiraceae bacterium]
MTIKEVEELLGIPRASIRFYEKEQLIHPKREDNGYREYEEKDVATLKKVIIFRKLGLPVSEIEDILDGSKPLAEALADNTARLEEQLAELNGAIALSKTIRQNTADIADFDENYYWEEVGREEEKGSRFMDIAKDIAQYQKATLLDHFGLADPEGNLNTSVRRAILVVIVGCLAWGATRWLIIERSLHSFLIGLAIPLMTSVFLVIVGYPLHCLLKRNPKTAKHEKWIIWAVALFICLVILDLATKYGW